MNDEQRGTLLRLVPPCPAVQQLTACREQLRHQVYMYLRPIDLWAGHPPQQLQQSPSSQRGRLRPAGLWHLQSQKRHRWLPKQKRKRELKEKGGRQSHFGQRGGSSPDRARSPCGQVWGQSVAAAAADDDDEVEVHSPRTLWTGEPPPMIFLMECLRLRLYK